MRNKTVPIALISALLLATALPLGSSERPPRAQAASALANGKAKDSPTDTRDVLDALFGKPTDGNGKAPTNNVTNQAPQDGAAAAKQGSEIDYAFALQRWNEQGLRPVEDYRYTVNPAQMTAEGRPLALKPAADSEGYSSGVFVWKEDTPAVEVPVTVPEDGLYEIHLDYRPLDDRVVPIERGLMVNGEYPFFQAKQFRLPKLWKNQTYPFAQDSLGNDILPDQEWVPRWQALGVSNESASSPLLFALRKGSNALTLTYVGEPVLLGRVTVAAGKPLPAYSDYRAALGADRPGEEGMTVLEAEGIAEKNEPYLRAQSDGDPSVMPYTSTRSLLNAFGGDSWKLGGQSASWTLEVPADGDYSIALKYRQAKVKSDADTDIPVYRMLAIDGLTPFAEMKEIAFPYTASWSNRVLADAAGNPYRFRLSAGTHLLTLTANAAPYQAAILTLQGVIEEVNDLLIQVKMATGGVQDVNRDWDLTEQLPDLSERLSRYAGELEKQERALVERIGRPSEPSKSLKLAVQILRRLAAEPNALPYRLSQLNGSSNSVMQQLGKTLAKLPNQPLLLDRIYVYGEGEPPAAKAGLGSRLKAGLSVFFHSFTRDYNTIHDNGGDSLKVWVNRPRQYVTTLQQMANEDFTRKTGISVTFSLMPDETKLILANAAGTAPDAALSVNTSTPFNLAVRSTLLNLQTFPDYSQTIGRFAPGAVVPYQFDGGTYGLPETQDFWVLFYRKDILQGLNIPVPDTLEDVKRILPELQRYGLNFYNPLAQTGGNKQLWLTAPYIYQHGGDLFTQDGGRTAIDSESAIEGIREMTDLFTVYNMPLNVPVFYDHLRDGSLPIGISNFTTYVQLMSAAPEISGLWTIAPLPGVADEQGTVERWAAGTAQTGIIFKSSKKQKEAWELLKWWTSAETQVKFGNRMQTVYGPTFLWNTANLDAFAQSSWPAEHVAVIRKQWEWLQDAPHVPGDYMLERQLSDAWNKIVFDGVNPRRAIEDATILTNRELAKKWEEFGYMKNGAWVRPPKLPALPSSERKGGTP